MLFFFVNFKIDLNVFFKELLILFLVGKKILFEKFKFENFFYKLGCKLESF